MMAVIAPEEPWGFLSAVKLTKSSPLPLPAPQFFATGAPSNPRHGHTCEASCIAEPFLLNSRLNVSCRPGGSAARRVHVLEKSPFVLALLLLLHVALPMTLLGEGEKVTAVVLTREIEDNVPAQ